MIMENNRFAFIFDMDGTLVDSMLFHFQTWLETFRELGVDVSLEQLQKANMGVISEVIRRLLGEDTTDAEIRKIAMLKEERFKKVYKPHMKLLPGLSKFLMSAQTAGIPMAIGTSAMYGNIDYVVDNLDLRQFFDAYVGDEDVQRGKPDPETFLLAAERLGMSADQCIVFEDSRSGIEASRRAGMKTIHVATGEETGDMHPSDHILLSISDYRPVTPENILQLARSSYS